MSATNPAEITEHVELFPLDESPRVAEQTVLRHVIFYLVGPTAGRASCHGKLPSTVHVSTGARLGRVPHAADRVHACIGMMQCP